MALSVEIPRPFVDVFKGKRCLFDEKLDVRHGLWNELVERQVLTTKQAAHCQVSVIDSINCHNSCNSGTGCLWNLTARMGWITNP